MNASQMLKANFHGELIVNKEGNVFAIEILSKFTSKINSSQVEYPAELVFYKNKNINKEELIKKQIKFIKNNENFFYGNNLICTLNIDYEIAVILCNNVELMNYLKKMSFVHLEISEKFRDLHEKKTKYIDKLNDNFILWLDDFGSGFANMSAVRNFNFEYVKIDKNFFWKNNSKLLWKTIIDDLKTYTKKIIIEGINCEKLIMETCNNHNIYGMQGYVFPRCNFNDEGDINLKNLFNIKK